LEAQLEQKRKRNLVIDSEDEQENFNMDSLHVLAEATLAQQPPSPVPKVVDTVKPKGPIMVQRRKHRHRLTKSSKVLVLDVEAGSSSVPAVSSIPAEVVRSLADVSTVQDTTSEVYTTIFVVGREYVISFGMV
jgi:hypothetical protein